MIAEPSRWIVNACSHSALKAFYAVDIVQLMGSGVCFGATMVGVIFMLRGSRS